jgi:hypothetical protein
MLLDPEAVVITPRDTGIAAAAALSQLGSQAACECF